MEMPSRPCYAAEGLTILNARPAPGGTRAVAPGSACTNGPDPSRSKSVTIRVIITGGTFDKHYDEIRGNLTFKDTHLPEIIKGARISVAIELELNQLIDSLDMQTANRLQVLESCRRAPEERIVITHGTDTMVETAEVLGNAGLAKAVVLTGAMVPYIFNNSDAVFNLGCAVAAVQLLPHGVYVAMNGRVFRWDRVRKNKELGVFEEAPAKGAQ
jgi:L-asparaginase